MSVPNEISRARDESPVTLCAVGSSFERYGC